MPFLPAKTKWDPVFKGKGKILYSDSFRMKYKKADIGIKQFVCPRRDDLNYLVSITLDDESGMLVRMVVIWTVILEDPKRSRILISNLRKLLKV